MIFICIIKATYSSAAGKQWIVVVRGGVMGCYLSPRESKRRKGLLPDIGVITTQLNLQLSFLYTVKTSFIYNTK